MRSEESAVKFKLIGTNHVDSAELTFLMAKHVGILFLLLIFHSNDFHCILETFTNNANEKILYQTKKTSSFELAAD